MVEDIFKIPLFYTDIDSEKVIFKKQKPFIPEPTFISKTLSSFNSNIKEANLLTEESNIYLLNIFSKLLSERFNFFKIKLTAVWTNKYMQDGYQEPHIHTDSNFSFIIYKKVDQSNTYFIAPNSDLIESFDMQDIFHPHFHTNFKSDTIALFPSFLSHGVKPSNNQETISGNINFEFTR